MLFLYTVFFISEEINVQTPIDNYFWGCSDQSISGTGSFLASLDSHHIDRSRRDVDNFSMTTRCGVNECKFELTRSGINGVRRGR